MVIRVNPRLFLIWYHIIRLLSRGYYNLGVFCTFSASMRHVGERYHAGADEGELRKVGEALEVIYGYVSLRVLKGYESVLC